MEPTMGRHDTRHDDTQHNGTKHNKLKMTLNIMTQHNTLNAYGLC